MNRRSASSMISSFRSTFALAAMFILLTFSCKESSNISDTQLPGRQSILYNSLTRPGELDEPMEMAFTGDGRILFVERKGNVKSIDLKTKAVKAIGFVPVNRKYTSKEGRVTEAEEGLMGIVVHPDFQKNHWIYMYYADTAVAKHVLARWELKGDSIDQSSKKIVLEIPTQRETCCHTGGGMVFDKDGNLFLTTGNNTGNPTAGTSALDEDQTGQVGMTSAPAETRTTCGVKFFGFIRKMMEPIQSRKEIFLHPAPQRPARKFTRWVTEIRGEFLSITRQVISIGVKSARMLPKILSSAPEGT